MQSLQETNRVLVDLRFQTKKQAWLARKIKGSVGQNLLSKRYSSLRKSVVPICDFHRDPTQARATYWFTSCTLSACGLIASVENTQSERVTVQRSELRFWTEWGRLMAGQILSKRECPHSKDESVLLSNLSSRQPPASRAFELTLSTDKKRLRLCG